MIRIVSAKIRKTKTKLKNLSWWGLLCTLIIIRLLLLNSFHLGKVTSKFQVSLYVFILYSMDAALCEDFKIGLLFKFRQAVPEIFYVPSKMCLFWKGLAVVSVISNGTKIVISGRANHLKSKLKFYNLWMLDPIHWIQNCKIVNILKQNKYFQNNGRGTLFLGAFGPKMENGH